MRYNTGRLNIASHARPYPNVPDGSWPPCRIDGQPAPPCRDAKSGHDFGRKWACMSTTGASLRAVEAARRAVICKRTGISRYGKLVIHS